MAENKWAGTEWATADYPGDHVLEDGYDPKHNGKAHAKPKPSPFADPVPFSQLRGGEDGADWIWHGFLARGGITLLSALWKVGKTTMLAHLLKALERGTPFCGLNTAPAKIMYVTEEPESLWAVRVNQIGLGDWCRGQIRPFKFKPYPADWAKFL